MFSPRPAEFWHCHWCIPRPSLRLRLRCPRGEKTGGADEALRPDAGITDGQADDATHRNVGLGKGWVLEVGCWGSNIWVLRFTSPLRRALGWTEMTEMLMSHGICWQNCAFQVGSKSGLGKKRGIHDASSSDLDVLDITFCLDLIYVWGWHDLNCQLSWTSNCFTDKKNIPIPNSCTGFGDFYQTWENYRKLIGDGLGYHCWFILGWWFMIESSMSTAES